MANYIYTTGVTTEPITYATAKDWLRLNDDTEQDIVTYLITAVRLVMEGQTWRPMTSQQWTMSLDKWELNTLILNINKAPLQSVDSVTYYDTNNALQTLGTTEWEADINGNPARFRLKTVPSVYDRMGALNINFTCGYVTLPEDLKQAMRMILGHFYENRQTVVTGTQVNEIPMSAQWILERYRNNFIWANNTITQ